MLFTKMPLGLAGYGLVDVTVTGQQRLGAGKTELELELLEEMDFRDGCG